MDLSELRTKIYDRIRPFVSSRNLLWIIISIGILLRFLQYLANHSLWIDESRLALNIVNKSFSELLEPLELMQMAPFGFLFVEKLLVQSFGNTEYILRLFPLICAIISIFLFFKIANHTVKKEAVVFALGLLALSKYLISYSAQVKQYSTDVTVALALYLVVIYLESKKLDLVHILLLGIVGAIAVWFSHPSAFILAGIGLSLASLTLTKREWKTLGKLLIIFAAWLISFAVAYFAMRQGANDRGVDASAQLYWMKVGWHWAFAPFPPSMQDAWWFVKAFFNLLENPIGLPLSGIATLAFIIGCVSMFSRNKKWFFMLLSPVLITLMVSGLRLYPFTGRFLLFLVPSFLLFIAEGAEYIRNKTNRVSPLIGFVVVVLLFFHPALAASYKIVTRTTYTPEVTEDIKPVMRYVQQNRKDGDTFYLYYGAEYAFKYYSEHFGFDNEDLIVGVDSRYKWQNYVKDMNNLRGNRRVWFLFSHVSKKRGVDEEKFFLSHLDSIGKQMDHFKRVGSSVYLYDLSEQAHRKGLSPRHGPPSIDRNISDD
jgi:hypothetical protein